MLAVASVALAIVASASGCLPTNSLKNSPFPTPTANGGLPTGSIGGAQTTTAPAPCNQIATSDPTFQICMACYKSVLNSHCPGQPGFDTCVDPSFNSTQPSDSHINAINQCIAQSTVAGFTCPITSCSNGMVLNSSTCTCVPPSPTPLSGAFQWVDVGQTDFGPPIVGAALPTVALTGSTVSPSSCLGTAPIWMQVLNRGNTVFRLNQYGTPRSNGAKNPSGKLYLPVPMGTVAPLQESVLQSAPVGANAGAPLNFETGGQWEVTGQNGNGTNAATGGVPSFLYTLSGNGSQADGGTNTAPTGAKGNSWMSPGFAARDPAGNLFFSDPVSNTIRVICSHPSALPWCSGGAATGSIWNIVGTPGQSGHAAGLLNSPHGIALDQYQNIYIADSGNHVIRVACSGNGTNPGVCNGQGMGTLIDVAGTANSPGASDNGNCTAGTLNYPMGVDVETDGAGHANIYVADFQSHSIRACCGFAPGGSAFCGGNGLTTLFNGAHSAGYDSTHARNPTDVKINGNHNIVFADYGNHAVRVICSSTGGKDYCGGKSNGATIAGAPPNAGGTGTPGDAGDGSIGPSGLITRPFQLAIGKQYADDMPTHAPVSGVNYANNTSFSDNNVIFTERLLPGGNLSPDFGQATAMTDPSILSANQTVTNITGNGGGATDGVPRNISVGQFFLCMLRASGGNASAWCQGRNDSSQIGNSTASIIQPTLIQVANISLSNGGATSITSGARHTCVIDNGGAVTCWGDNSTGQLGKGDTTTPTQPAAGSGGVPGTFAAIQAGDDFTCAVDSGNGAKCWGNNASAQLGCQGNCSPAPAFSPSPVAVDQTGVGAGTTVLQIAAGSAHACETYSQGGNVGVACWGSNSIGQIGNGGVSAPLKRPAIVISNASNQHYRIAAGGTHTCALNTSTNALTCWGENDKGQIGNGSTGGSANSPTAVVGLPITPSMIALGTKHTCAANSSTVYCWGDNSSEQLGNDLVARSSVPMEVQGLTGTIQELQANGYNTCVRTQVGSGQEMLCWGSNDYLQIGNNTSGTPTAGNIIRLLCGDNSSAPSTGFCRGQKANTLFTIGGKSGQLGTANENEGFYAPMVRFAGLTGVTYDLFKNVVITSSGNVERSTDPNNPTQFKDFSVRFIMQEVVGSLLGTMYTFTDSDAQTSNYCLRLRPLTGCDPDGNCECRLVAPTTDFDPLVWEVKAPAYACP